jgi:hypothetical protein
MEIAVPASPTSGTMFLMEGLAPVGMVVLVAVIVAVFETVRVVAGIVGVCIGIDERALLVIFV